VNRSYSPVIDWLKSLGIALILYGHLAARAPLADLPPIYSKQIGVALFLFASGYSLSAETRDRWRVVFNRLFEVFLFGLSFALLVSSVSFVNDGRLQLSNYLPFAAGANVLFNNFPANPTTWYLGTYLHFVLLWAIVLRGVPITAWILVLSFAGEIAVRALLINTAGSFVAYMLAPNWSTAFLLGCWHRQHNRPSGSFTWPLVSLVAAVVGWAVLTAPIPFDESFPFMRLAALAGFDGALVVSLMVSVIYVGVTELVYRSVSPLPAPGPVRFVARNTLIIFLAHMPLYYALVPLMMRWQITGAARSGIYLVLCLPGLALVSEAVRYVVQPQELRKRLYARLQRLAA
jgi:peptidoglycan/LPS O-acetylase OafA/YrhL